MGAKRLAVSVALGAALGAVVIACVRPTPKVVEVTRIGEEAGNGVEVTEIVEVEVEVVVGLPTPPAADFATLVSKKPDVKKGELGGSEEWQGTILVTSTLTVPARITLTIKPETLVLFGKGSGLLVLGTLKAEGASEKKPIVFQRETKQVGFWEGITVTGKTARASLKFCQVRFGDRSNIRISDGASAKIEACDISKAKWDGIEVAANGKAEIDSNRIHDNGRWGIHVHGSQDCNIHHNLIYDHIGSVKSREVPNAVHLWNGASCDVHSNTLVNSGQRGWGIELGFVSNPTITDNIIVGFQHAIIVHEVLSKGMVITNTNAIVIPKDRKVGQKVRDGDRVLWGERRSKPDVKGNYLWNNWQHYSEQVVEGAGKIIERGKNDGYALYAPEPLPASNCRADPKLCDLGNKDFRLKSDSPAGGKGAYPEPLSKDETTEAKCK